MHNEIQNTDRASPGNHPLAGVDEKLLNRAIQELLQAERLHEDYAEKYLELYSRDGNVELPTGHLLATPEFSICLRGTDDHVFKDFVEYELRPLFARLESRAKRTWKLVHLPSPPSRARKPTYALTRLGNAILACCRSYEPRWSVAYCHHVFHPDVTIMLRAMQRRASVVAQAMACGREGLADPAARRAFDEFARFVRRVARSWRFVNAVRAREEQAHSNFSSARNFIIDLAEEHSKLLILRIDLYLAPYHDAQGRDALDLFTRWLRGKKCRSTLLPGYLGFIVKEENGITRGHHWHLMVIAKGNLQRTAYYLTQKLGEEWARRTGQGPGSYHNCYADRARYRANGLGVLELWDWRKMLGLRIALHYMTKQDCVLVASNDRVKHFWRSTSKCPDRPRRGRPRKSSDSVALLRWMLRGKRSRLPPGVAG